MVICGEEEWTYLNSIDYSLYLVTDETKPKAELLSIVESAVIGGVTVVQLREKKSKGNEFYEKALALKALLDRYSVPLIINDRVDIALAVGASGVHIGQDDIPLQVVKSIIPSTMIVGVSVKTLEAAKIAEENGGDYLGVGSCFPTSTKDDAELLADGMLQKIRENVHIPIVAIGGINKENISELIKYQPNGYAVVSAIIQADNPKEATKNLLREINL